MTLERIECAHYQHTKKEANESKMRAMTLPPLLLLLLARLSLSLSRWFELNWMQGSVHMHMQRFRIDLYMNDAHTKCIYYPTLSRSLSFSLVFSSLLRFQLLSLRYIVYCYEYILFGCMRAIRQKTKPTKNIIAKVKESAIFTKMNKHNTKNQWKTLSSLLDFIFQNLNFNSNKFFKNLEFSNRHKFFRFVASKQKPNDTRSTTFPINVVWVFGREW